MTKEVLRFKEIEFKNFRPYMDQTLLFSDDPKKLITIFEGRNSAGKTSIVYGINWCLYDEERIEENKTAKPRCNSAVLNSLKVGDTIDTSIKITLTDERGDSKYIIQRNLHGKKNSEDTNVRWDPNAFGEVPAGMSFTKSCSFSTKNKNGSWDVTDNDSVFYERVSKIMPKGILEFIIFDGEQLDNFFKEDAAEKIKTGIERVSGLPIIDKAIEHWDSIETQYSRRVAKVSGTNAQILQGEVERIENAINTKKKEIEIGEKNEKELKNQQEQLEIQQEKFPVQALEVLQESLEGEKRHKKEYQDAVERFRAGRQKHLVENFPRVLCDDLIINAFKILQESEIQGLTPPPIYDFFIDKLIKEKKCMCGTDLNSNNHAMKSLIELREQVTTSQISKLANEGKEVIDGLLKKTEGKVDLEVLNEFRDSEEKFGAAFREAQSKVDGLFTKLEDYDEKQIRKTATSLKTIRDKKNSVLDLLQLYKSQLLAKEIELKQKKLDLEKAEGLTDTNKQWKIKKEFATKTKETLTQIKDELLNSIRITVQDRTKEIFKRLIAKGEEIKELTIDPDYNISIIDKSGNSLFPLSAGQRLYLSLSYIAAIRDVTDTNFPMVIDSPLGRVDGWARVEAAKMLPSFLPETQITCLVTNVEYDAVVEKDSETGKRIPSVKELWQNEKKIWKRFVLKFPLNQSESTNTEIEEVEK